MRFDQVRKSHPGIKTLDKFVKLKKKNAQFAKTVFVLPGSEVQCTGASTYHATIKVVLSALLASQPSNVLCSGYSWSGTVLTCTRGNWAISALLSQEWYDLYEDLGAAKFASLLTSNTVFVTLGNGGLMQLSGVPAVKTGTMMRNFMQIEIPKLDSDIAKLNSSVIVKAWVMHRPPQLDSTRSVIFQLPPSCAIYNKGLSEDQNQHRLLAAAFPLEFEAVLALQVDRKSVIKTSGNEGGNVRYKHLLPDSLGDGIVSLFDGVMSRHKNLPYGRILESICPVDNRRPTIMPRVATFCFTIIRRLLPKNLLGSSENWQVLRVAIERFVNLRDTEVLPLRYIVEGIRTTEIPWFNESADMNGENADTNEVTDTIKSYRPLSDKEFLQRKQLLLQLLHWIFRRVLVPLIGGCFYVTKHSAEYNSMYYYRHDVWQERSTTGIDAFITAKLERVNSTAVASPLSLGSARLRIAAKRSDGAMRAITVMGSKKKHKKAFTINAKLEPVFQVLTSEMGKMDDPSRVKSTVDFKERLESLRGQRYYCVSVDIANCFDTIPAELAYQCVEELLTKETYTMQAMQAYHVRTGFDMKVVTTGADFHEYNPAASTITLGPKHAARLEKRSDILEMLHKHLFQSYIKLSKKKYYRQIKGIPQGSVLSSLLCNLVYCRMEQECLSGFKTEQSKLFRYVDDFLYVTPDISLATSFLEVMSQGFPKYGAFTSPSKTRTNFGPNAVTTMSYIGFQFNPSNLYIRDSDPGISNAQAYALGPRPRNPQQTLLAHITSSVRQRAKLHILYTPQSVRKFAQMVAGKIVFVCEKAGVERVDAVNKMLQHGFTQIIGCVQTQHKHFDPSELSKNVEIGIKRGLQRSKTWSRFVECT